MKKLFSWLLQSIKKYFAEPLMWIRGWFFITSRVPFLLIIIGFGCFGFILNDQGKDLMMAFRDISLFHPYLLSFTFLLIIWSGILWYVARLVLTSANLRRIVDTEVSLSESLKDPQCSKNCALKEDHIVVSIDSLHRRSIQKIAKIAPRVFACLPYLLFLWSYYSVNKFNGWVKMVIVLLIGVIHVTYLCYRTIIFKDKKQPIAASDERFLLGQLKDPIAIIYSQMLRNTTKYIIPVVFLGSFFYAWITARSVPSLEGKPGLIILCGLIFYSLVGLLMDYISNWLKFPFFWFLLLLMLFISLPYNNNHAILATVNQENAALQINNRKQDSNYFKEWLEQKWKSNQLINNGDTIPVFIMAAEGGGIRACYWTEQVLKQLHLLYPELYNNTFAVTGASGGTVGLSFFYNYIYQQSKNDITVLNKKEFYASLDTIAASDFLSGVTYGFLFPDLLQRAIPWPIASFDRAKFLNNAFSGSFRKHTGNGDNDTKTILDQSVLISSQESNAFNFPVILYNSLFVEQGQKAIFSPYKLSEIYYKDVLDIFDSTRVLVPVTEAMVSSARFPIITPPGLMQKADGTKLGHLVDGGYFENTAIQTAQQTAIMIKRISSRLNLGGKKVVPYIIALKYGSGTKKAVDALGAGYETAPIKGGINTLFRWIDGANAITTTLDKDLNSIEFRLPKYKGDIIPLGWYLSNPSRKLIEEYALPGTDQLKKPLAQLKRLLRN
ncbi:MAG: hypothetical protein ACKVOW_11435 [Chitinophagaceae bacterium]